MPSANEKLAQSLQALHALEPARAIPAKALTRVHRERLRDAGFLSEVVKGWYIQTRPNEGVGDSTVGLRVCGSSLLATAPSDSGVGGTSDRSSHF